MKEEASKKRVILRIPARIPAKIFSKTKFYKDTYISDLSSGGISFYIEEEDFSLEEPELEFRLGFFSKPVKVKIEVKNKIKTSQGLRIGCAFLHLGEKEKRLINNYICNFVNFYGIFKLLGTASFLCIIDGLWRIFAYFTELAYGVIKYNISIYEFILKNSYIFLLLLYILSSVIAFLCTTAPKNLKERRKLLLGIGSLSISFFFLLFRNIAYWRMDLSLFSLSFLSFFLGIEFLLLLFVIFSISIGIFSIKRINLILSAIDTHYSFLNK